MAELNSINTKKNNELGDAFREFEDKAISEIYRLQNIVRLAAFACEARRTLEAYQDHAEHFPDFQKHFAVNVEAAGNWSSFQDVSAEVLRDVDSRLGALAEDIYEGSAAIEKQIGCR